MNMRSRAKLTKTAIYIAITAIIILMLFPFFWMVSTSLKDKTEIFSAVPRLIPKKISFENFESMWVTSKSYIFMKNSIIVAVATTIVSLLFSTFLAYGVSRFRFRGKTLVLNLLILTQMFPLTLLVITIFVVFANLGLLDSRLGLVIAYCTFSLPFATIMLKSSFDDLPVELEESAAMDGCSPIGTIFKIVIPLAAPSIAAMGLFSFILAWQEFMMALTLIRTTDYRTLPVAINMMLGQREVSWGPLMAATTAITLPVVILFIYFQKYLISGLTMGAVKG